MSYPALYRKRTDNKLSFRNTWKAFTDAVGVDANEFTDTVYNRYTIEDFSYSDDWKFEVVRLYFQNVVIPHKIAVYQAGIDFSRSEAFKGLGGFEKEQFIDNLIYHDISKFSEQEAFGYAFYDFEKGEATYPGMSFESAWHHHKQNNPHHPEYWLSVGKDGNVTAMRMPEIYIAEMIADWIGAGITYGNPIESWLPGNLEKFAFDYETAERLEFVLFDMGFRTEAYVTAHDDFAHVRFISKI